LYCYYYFISLKDAVKSSMTRTLHKIEISFRKT